MKLLTPEEFYKKEKRVGTYEQNFSGWDMIKFAQAYTNHFLENAVSDEEIEKKADEYADKFEGYHYDTSYGTYQDSAKWLKEQLLKKIK